MSESDPKIITNQSGGVDIAAEQVNIGGDVVGRDKIVSNAYNFTGDFVTLEDLYIRPDSVFQRVHIKDFIGRDWLTTKVDALLNDPKRKSGALLLVGEAGVGKTSFLAHLVAERNYLHLFAEQVPGDANLSRALQSLGAQLVARYQIDPYTDRNTLPAIATFPDFLARLLRLAAAKLGVGEKIVIVCDALDEAGTAPNGNVFGLPSVLPDGVYFILSQRPIPVRLNIKEGLLTEMIEAAGTDNLHDVEQYLSVMARRPEVSSQLHAQNYDEADFVRILAEKSGGIWIYVHYVVSEIASGNRAPLDLTKLPSGLAGYYAEYWGDWAEGRNGRGAGPIKWDSVYAPLLATLAAAQLPMSLNLLMAWSKNQTTAYEVERLLRREWGAFVTEREIDHIPYFSLYHASLRDFLTGKVDRQGLTLGAGLLVDELTYRTRDAHARIVEYYRRQCDGEWVRLVEDEYARVYLCLHLPASGDDEAMYQLVAMSNAWAETRYAKEGSYAGYLMDLDRAWQWVDSEEGWNVGRQIRCALIESSIHSLAGNISPDLLRLLIETWLWRPGRALANIHQVSDHWVRTESLIEIIPLLPNNLKLEALNTARVITNDDFRAHALSNLAPHLPDDLKAEALAVSRTITDNYHRARALTGLAPYLPDDLKTQATREALATARAISHADTRALALSELAPHLLDDSRAEAIRESLLAARAVAEDDQRVYTLSNLAQHLPEDVKAEVIAAARALTDEYNHAAALSRLAPYLPDRFKTETLNDACAITNERYRAQALSGLAPYLPDSLKAEALAAARALIDNFDRAQALSSLAPHLPIDLKDVVVREALAAAKAITDDETHIRVLSDLAPHLPDDLKSEAVREALVVARAIIDNSTRICALSTLAPHLPDDLKAEAVCEALAVTRIIADEYAQAQALVGLAPHLSSHLRVEALDTARGIADEYAHTLALSGLTDYLPKHLRTEVIREALATVYAVNDDISRIFAISDLAPHLPDNLKAKTVHQALATARTLTDEYNRTQALSSLVPHLPDNLLPEGLAIAHSISIPDYRAEVLSSLAPRLPEDLRAEALAAACAISDNAARAQSLSSLAQILSRDLMVEILDMVCTLTDEYICTYVLTSLAPHLPEDLQSEALAAARAIGDAHARARSLSSLVPNLPDDRKTPVIQEVLAAASAIINYDYLVAHDLSDLAPHLPDDLKAEALAAARAITDEAARAQALSGLAPILSNDLKLIVLAEAFTLNQNAFFARGDTCAKVISTWCDMHFIGFRIQSWKDTLHVLAHNPRKELLDNLTTLLPLIEHLGDDMAICEFFFALRDVMQWWP